MNKILIIENEDRIRDIIVEILDAEGFEVIQAEDGALGLQLAQQHLPALILCDIMMPKLNGHGVLEQLKQNSVTENIPFIFLTAKAGKADMRIGMNLGADDYLTKPFTMLELLETVNVRLAKRASVQKHYTAQIQRLEAGYASQLQQIKARLNHLLHADSETLSHQLTLQERFDRLLQQWEMEPPGEGETKASIVPILCLQFDRFDQVEESLGNELSALLFNSIVERLFASIGDRNLVAKLNTNEFAIVLGPVENRQTAADIAQTLLDNLAQPFSLKNHQFVLPANIGISVFPHDGTQLEKLLSRSRNALFLAQQQGKNQYRFYQAENRIVTLAQLALETDLRSALKREELQLYYQPKVNLKTAKVVGAEALLRWHHPERGVVSPGTFIPLAEETGLIDSIGEWVLWSACKQAKVWQDRGLDCLTIAANLSARQFNQPKLSQQLSGILRDTDLNPTTLELELTESTLVEHPDMAIRSLEALKAMGIQIAIDDFGTGYSSLGYLQKFPFDILKIDRCFVRNINTNHKNAAIAQAIIEMAHQMKLKTIAEGVETEAELSFFMQHQCDAIQGYFFSRPLPAEEFENFVRDSQNLTAICA